MALKEVTKILREYNIKCNPTKLQYCVSKVKFVGFVFSNEGVHPDSNKLKAIRELKEKKIRKKRSLKQKQEIM